MYEDVAFGAELAVEMPDDGSCQPQNNPQVRLLKALLAARVKQVLEHCCHKLTHSDQQRMLKCGNVSASREFALQTSISKPYKHLHEAAA